MKGFKNRLWLAISLNGNRFIFYQLKVLVNAKKKQLHDCRQTYPRRGGNSKNYWKMMHFD